MPSQSHKILLQNQAYNDTKSLNIDTSLLNVCEYPCHCLLTHGRKLEKRQTFTFSQAQAHASADVTGRRKNLRGLSRILSLPEVVLVSIYFFLE